MENGGPVRCHRIRFDRIAVLGGACLAALDKYRFGLDSDPLDGSVGSRIRTLGAKETQMTPTQMQSLAIAATVAILFTVFGGSLVEWSKWLARRLNKEKPIHVAQEPQATVGLLDLLVTFSTLFALFYAAAILWGTLGLPAVAPKVKDVTEAVVSNSSGESVPVTTGSNGTPVVKPAVMTQNQVLYSGFAMSAQIVCVLLVTLFIVGRTGCTFKKLGWRTDQIAGDILAGLKCFLMMSPVILILNAVLQGVTKTPYEHPVQEMIKQYPWLLGIAFWQAAIVAPISEEFGFRVLLIGWFESIHFGRNKTFAFMFGASGIALAEQPAPAEIFGSSAPARFQPPWWPVLLSGTLFGLAHFNYGVSWVPLIVFGVVLGRLYQVRQSILPVLLVHFLFNGMNVTLLGLSLLMPVALEG